MAFALNEDGTLKVLEADVQRAVCDLFEAHGWMVIRTPAGMARQYRHKERLLRLGPKGRPDLLVVQPTRAVWIELKRPRGGRLSVEQRAWRGWLRARGYEYLLIRDVAEAEQWLEEQ